MPKVIWGLEAEQDLREVAYYIGVQRQSPQAARRLVESIRRKCDLYSNQPELGERRSDLEPDIRVFRVGN